MFALGFRRSVSSELFAFVLVFAGLASAQSAGAIQGTVTDSSGAAVPNAPIDIHNQRTGEERATTTDSSGIYLVASLPVGVYNISVKAPGMSPVTATDLEVLVGSTIKQDFALKVASSTETVEVVAAPPLVDTNSVAASTVVNQYTVSEIPLKRPAFRRPRAVNSWFCGAAR